MERDVNNTCCGLKFAVFSNYPEKGREGKGREDNFAFPALIMKSGI